MLAIGEGGSLHPYAYGTLNGQPFNQPCGHQSKNWDKIKNGDFELDTLYVGHKSTNPISLVLYDKAKESFDRYGSISSSKSRIEARLNFYNLNDQDYNEHVSICKDCLIDYFGPYA